MEMPTNPRCAELAPQDRLSLYFGEQDESDLRKEVVARGKRLAADSTYPPFFVCEQIAATWLTSISQD